MQTADDDEGVPQLTGKWKAKKGKVLGPACKAVLDNDVSTYLTMAIAVGAVGITLYRVTKK